MPTQGELFLYPPWCTPKFPTKQFYKRTPASPRKSNLLNGISLFLRVQPHLQKYFGFSEIQIKLYDSLSRPTKERSRSSRTRGGMRWTRQRLARNVIAGRICP